MKTEVHAVVSEDVEVVRAKVAVERRDRCVGPLVDPAGQRNRQVPVLGRIRDPGTLRTFHRAVLCQLIFRMVGMWREGEG